MKDKNKTISFNNRINCKMYKYKRKGKSRKCRKLMEEKQRKADEKKRRKRGKEKKNRRQMSGEIVFLLAKK